MQLQKNYRINCCSKFFSRVGLNVLRLAFVLLEARIMSIINWRITFEVAAPTFPQSEIVVAGRLLLHLEFWKNQTVAQMVPVLCIDSSQNCLHDCLLQIPLLVIFFFSSFASNSICVNISGFTGKDTCNSEAGYSFSYSGNLQIIFVEQLNQFVLRNFIMRTSFQVQITLPVESSFQGFIKRKKMSLQTKRGVRWNGNRNYSIISTVITDPKRNVNLPDCPLRRLDRCQIA